MSATTGKPLVIHQFIPSLSHRDAVGTHSKYVSKLLESLGHKVITFFDAASRRILLNQFGRLDRYQRHTKYPAPDLIIYQASTGSPIADYLLERDEPLILNYHNITPAEFYEPWSTDMSTELRQARNQLQRLCQHAKGAIADSTYNANELTAVGLDNVVVSPVMWDLPKPPKFPHSISLSKSSSKINMRPINMLYVGRLAPNKACEDLIAIAVALRDQGHSPHLRLVGRASPPSYERHLQELVNTSDAHQIVKFCGSISPRALAKEFARADVYMSASKHEGFCVPILEAMAAGVPVIANPAGAVPETAGNAAHFITTNNLDALAAAVVEITDNQTLRSDLIQRGHQRASELSLPTAATAFKNAFDQLRTTL